MARFPLFEKGTILVVTGPRGIGKTTYCQNAVEAFRESGLKVSGLLTPGRYEKDHKNGIIAVDLDSHESRLVASAVPGEIDGIRFGAWSFDAETFIWGNERILQASEPDLLVIDELGYLEFDLNTGWTAGFEVLRRTAYRLALVIIRPECIAAFSAMGFSFHTKEIQRSQHSSIGFEKANG